jgi:hypothetical protein
MEVAASVSTRPTAKRPASREATTRLRSQSSDHVAEAVPQTRRQPSSTAAAARTGRGLRLLADKTRPAPHSPAIETSATTALGRRTRSGKNSTAAPSRPASQQTAMRLAVRSEVNRDRGTGLARLARLLPAASASNDFSSRNCNPGDFNLRAYINSGEEEGDLVNGVLERVRTMHRIGLDRLGEILTDCP